MSIFNDFISFIMNADSDIVLDHTRGFDGCAVGLFNSALAAADESQMYTAEPIDTWIAIDSAAVGTALMTADFNDGNANGCVDSYTFAYAINDSCIMQTYAPTMGHMQQFIRDHYPALVG